MRPLILLTLMLIPTDPGRGCSRVTLHRGTSFQTVTLPTSNPKPKRKDEMAMANDMAEIAMEVYP